MHQSDIHASFPRSIACGVLLFATIAACKGKPAPDPEPWVSRAPPTETSKVELTSAKIGGGVSTLSVPGDKDVLVVESAKNPSRPLVHLHGMCSSPRDDVNAFGSALSELGTVIALSGDVACPEGGGRVTWSQDSRALHQRISAAMDAVAAHGVKLDRAELVLIGESLGASRAESLAALEPEQYHRLVLVGPPQAASANRLASVSAVATLAGEKERQDKAVAGKNTLEQAGRKVQFWELPGATHGEYGPEGGRIMKEAVSFVIEAR